MDWEKLKHEMGVPQIVLDYMDDNKITTYQKYCKWLDTYGDELLIRTFAFKEDKRKGLEWTEVERAIPGEEYSLQKNIYLTAMSGYRCVFKPCNKTSTSWYGYSYYYFSSSDFDQWYTNKSLPGWMGTILNLDFLFTVEKYKYCGFSQKQGLKEYLEFYNQDHSVEFFGKLGLVYQKSLAKDAKKDKQFRKFIMQHAEEVNIYKYTVTRMAYKNNMTFKEANALHLKQVEVNKLFRDCLKTNYKVDKIKIYEYVKNKLGYYWGSYRDYWNACVELGLDMRDTKNSMPKDFVTMHDIRIDEYASLKATREAEQRKEFNNKLAKIAEEYAIEIPSDKYEIILPHSKTDFLREGTALNHCVGRMGYDTKMYDGKILIGFIRKKSEPTKPFYTTEYNLADKKIVQIHGKDNRSAPKDVKEFVEAWAKALKKKGATA